MQNTEAQFILHRVMCGALLSAAPVPTVPHSKRQYTPPDYQLMTDYVGVALCLARDWNETSRANFYSEIAEAIQHAGFSSKNVSHNLFRMKYCEALPFVCESVAVVASFVCDTPCPEDEIVSRLNRHMQFTKVLGAVPLRNYKFNAKTTEHECTIEYLLPGKLFEGVSLDQLGRDVLPVFANQNMVNYGGHVTAIRHINIWHEGTFYGLRFHGTGFREGVVERVVRVIVDFCRQKRSLRAIEETFSSSHVDIAPAPSAPILLARVYYELGLGSSSHPVNFPGCESEILKLKEKSYRKIKKLWRTNDECISFLGSYFA